MRGATSLDTGLAVTQGRFIARRGILIGLVSSSQIEGIEGENGSRSINSRKFGAFGVRDLAREVLRLFER